MMSSILQSPSTDDNSYSEKSSLATIPMLYISSPPGRLIITNLSV